MNKHISPYSVSKEIPLSKIEIQDKVDLYLAKGAQEVWVAYALDEIHVYTCMGVIDQSNFLKE